MIFKQPSIIDTALFNENMIKTIKTYTIIFESQDSVGSTNSQ